jgi:SAM-dependent methyltransferase
MSEISKNSDFLYKKPGMRRTGLLKKNINEFNRQAWLKEKLTNLPQGWRILDAGAGEGLNKKYCSHLQYVSQDFCQYEGSGGSHEGLHPQGWDTHKIDIVSDITDIPEPDGSFGAILCSEVLEHVPEPDRALNEFERLLKLGGVLILTAPFGSNVHMAPYHFCTGFSRYWYEYHLKRLGFDKQELVPNGDWHALLTQEVLRLGGVERRRGKWYWPLAYAAGIPVVLYLIFLGFHGTDDLACFGWHCVAVKQHGI